MSPSPRPPRPTDVASKRSHSRPTAIGIAVLAALAALALLARPESPALWGVNGFRSVEPPVRMFLLGFALALPGLAIVLSRFPIWRWPMGAALACVIAFPLRERIHFLGDTGPRTGALGIYLQGLDPKPLTAWAHQIHANPMDVLVNFLVPIGLSGLGVGIEFGVPLVSCALGLCFLAGSWRLASRFAATPLRGVVCAVLVMTGLLEAFAGYSESAGLVLVAAVWWWAALLGPLDTRRRALTMAGGWLILFLCHRIAFIMLVPLIWRSLGRPHLEDRPEARHWLRAAGAVALVAAVVLLVVGGGSRQSATDVGELLTAFRSPLARLAPAWDIANLLILIAPAAALAPALMNRPAWATWRRRWDTPLVLAGVLPLLPFAVQVGPSGLGLHRDWDANALLGLLLTMASLQMLSGLSPGRSRGALLWMLPVVALISLSWVAVNADEAAGVRRAAALATRPGHLAASQRGQVLLYLGGWTASRGRLREAAQYYERSYELAPTPNRGLLGAFSWARAGDLMEARRLLALVRARGGLDAAARISADSLEAGLQRAELGAPAAGGSSAP